VDLDTVEKSEYDALVAKYGEDKIEGNALRFLSDEDTPITKAMIDEIEKITGTSGEDAAEMVAGVLDNMEEDTQDPMAGFENWVNKLGEESPITMADEEEKADMIKKLNGLLNTEFQAGVDGTNAITSLEGIIEDPKLEQDIKKADPEQDVRPMVKAWVEENAPDVLDQLDFGDMVDEPAVGADEVEPQQEEDATNEGGMSDVMIGAEELVSDYTNGGDKESGLKMSKDKVIDAIKGEKADAMEIMYAIQTVENDFDDKGNYKYTGQDDMPEGVTNEGTDVEDFMTKIANSDDGYELMDQGLDGKHGPEIQKELQRMYDDVAVDNGYHPDDDFEKIHDRMIDNITDDYGTNEAVVGGNARPIDPNSVFARLGNDIQSIMNDALDGNDMADDITDELGDYLRNGDAPEGSHYEKAIQIVMSSIHDGPQAQAEAAEEAISVLHSEEKNPKFADEGNEFSKKVQDLKAQGAKKGTKFKTSDGEEHTLESVAEFIHSFYDRNTGTFPKGPEGVCTMVGKKFGEQAEMIARKMVERMAPAQEQGAEDLEELERIKSLIQY
jgi:hypothetical protein